MAKKSSARGAAANAVSTRDQIKRVTTELLIKHGFHGTNFRTIATRLKTTTTNIHYHFGRKRSLVEEVVREYVSDASLRQRDIWLDETVSLREKMRMAAALNYQRYRKFNRGAHTNRPWSLIGRLRLEIDVLSPVAVASLTSFAHDVHSYVGTAIEIAADKGELAPDAPLLDIGVLLANIVSSAYGLSQDAQSFERLGQLFSILEDLIFTAYGDEASQVSPQRAGQKTLSDGRPGRRGTIDRTGDHKGLRS